MPKRKMICHKVGDISLVFQVIVEWRVVELWNGSIYSKYILQGGGDYGDGSRNVACG